jgi:hypothetical protein
MPYEYRFESGERMLYATLRGPNSFEISRDAILALARDSRVRARMRILVDMGENTYVPTIPEAHQLTKLFRAPGMFQANPVALVISRDEHYGLANLVALIGSTGGTPIRVFTECRHAEEWLRSLAPEE